MSYFATTTGFAVAWMAQNNVLIWDQKGKNIIGEEYHCWGVMQDILAEAEQE